MMGEKRLFAIGDLHLSLAKEKPMDIFGDNWKDHSAKIKENWLKIVDENDTVLIPGDISWAMTMEEAKIDLDFISALPGKKVLIKGNHDYWWGSVSRLNGMYENMYFLQNDCYMWGNIAICGSRGWMMPVDPKFKKEDEKILLREVKRGQLSLDNAVKKGAESIIFMSHYPPLYMEYQESVFTEAFEKYNIKKAVYGHLHGRENFVYAFEGSKNGIEYSLVSADYVDFMPRRII